MSGAEGTAADAHPEQRAGIIAGLTAYTLWGLLTLYWKQLAEFNAFELIGWRIMSAALVMTIVLSVTHSWKGLAVLRRDRRLLGRVAVAAVLLTINWTSYVWAVVHGRVLETALGYFIAPIGTMLVGVFVLHETLRTAQRVALGLAFAAVAVLTWSYGQVPLIAILLAVSWVSYGYMKKHVPLTPMESMAAESFVLVVPAIIVVAVLGNHSDSVINSASGPHLGMVAFTGVATVLPLMLFAFAAQRVPLTVIGPMQYIVPSMNFLIGWLLYDESLPPSRILGFALVWTALAVLTVDSAARSRRNRVAEVPALAG